MFESLNRRTFLSVGAAASLGASALGASPRRPVGTHRPIGIYTGAV